MSALRNETSTVGQSIASRTQELADVGRRLEEARQQEVKTREDLVRIGQEMATKTAELAQAEQRLQQARELEARLQAVRQEMADAEAKLAEARKQLVVPQSPGTPTEEPAPKQ